MTATILAAREALVRINIRDKSLSVLTFHLFVVISFLLFYLVELEKCSGKDKKQLDRV